MRWAKFRQPETDQLLPSYSPLGALRGGLARRRPGHSRSHCLLATHPFRGGHPGSRSGAGSHGICPSRLPGLTAQASAPQVESNGSPLRQNARSLLQNVSMPVSVLEPKFLASVWAIASDGRPPLRAHPPGLPEAAIFRRTSGALCDRNRGGCGVEAKAVVPHGNDGGVSASAPINMSARD